MPVLLRVQKLPNPSPAKTWRLLRLLLIQPGPVPPAATSKVLWCVADMANDASKMSRDWLRSPGTNLLAWWVPLAALFAGLFASVPFRAAIWIIALGWMGIACILNARRCGHTHCRYADPYILMMIAPVILLSAGVASGGIYAWLLLGWASLLGSTLLWWTTEPVWGRFS